MGFISTEIEPNQHGSGCTGGTLSVGIIGEKNGRTMPMSTDHFVLKGTYEALFHSVYGEKPTTVEIMFTGNDSDFDELVRLEYPKNGRAACEIREPSFLKISSILNGEIKFYETPKGKFAACDGAKFYFWDSENMQWIQHGIPDLSGMTELKYRHTLVLRFRIPKLKVDTLFVYRTSGKSSREPIKATIIEAQKTTGKYFSHVPFDMNVRISKGNNRDVRFPVVSIALNMNKIQEMNQLSLRPVADHNQIIPKSRQLAPPKDQNNEEVYEPEYEGTEDEA